MMCHMLHYLQVLHVTCTTHIFTKRNETKQTLKRNHDMHVYLLDGLLRYFYVTFDHSQDAAFPNVQSVFENVVPTGCRPIPFTILATCTKFSISSKEKGKARLHP